MSDSTAMKRLDSSSSSTAAGESVSTTAVTTPEVSQSRQESENGADDSIFPAAKTTLNVEKVTTKLCSLAIRCREAAAAAEATAVAAGTTLDEPRYVVPGSDEGHPIDPLLRIYDPTKDDLSIEELLARPRLPRAPNERIALARYHAAVKAKVEADDESWMDVSEDEKEITLAELREQFAAFDEEVKKKEMAYTIRNVRKMARELNIHLSKNWV